MLSPEIKPLELVCVCTCACVCVCACVRVREPAWYVCDMDTPYHAACSTLQPHVLTHRIEPSLHPRSTVLCDWPYLCGLTVDVHGHAWTCVNVRVRACTCVDVRACSRRFACFFCSSATCTPTEAACAKQSLRLRRYPRCPRYPQCSIVPTRVQLPLRGACLSTRWMPRERCDRKPHCPQLYSGRMCAAFSL